MGHGLPLSTSLSVHSLHQTPLPLAQPDPNPRDDLLSSSPTLPRIVAAPTFPPLLRNPFRPLLLPSPTSIPRSPLPASAAPIPPTRSDLDSAFSSRHRLRQSPPQSSPNPLHPTLESRLPLSRAERPLSLGPLILLEALPLRTPPDSTSALIALSCYCSPPSRPLPYPSRAQPLTSGRPVAPAPFHLRPRPAISLGLALSLDHCNPAAPSPHPLIPYSSPSSSSSACSRRLRLFRLPPLAAARSNPLVEPPPVYLSSSLSRAPISACLFLTPFIVSFPRLSLLLWHRARVVMAACWVVCVLLWWGIVCCSCCCRGVDRAMGCVLPVANRAMG